MLIVFVALIRAKPHDDFDITIIMHNMDCRSNFIRFQKESRGLIELILAEFTKILELGLFEEVISVNASKKLFCVTVCYKKNMDTIMCVH